MPMADGRDPVDVAALQVHWDVTKDIVLRVLYANLTHGTVSAPKFDVRYGKLCPDCRVP